MRRWLCICIVYVLAFGAAAIGVHAQSGADLVEVQNGWIQGTIQGNVRVFKGIPFAAPPVGSNRWQPPQSAANWTGVKTTQAFAASCAQELLTGSQEDCLYLDVFAPLPPQDNSTLFPVMVFIHGGGYMFGSAKIYDGAPDVAEIHNVVIVTVQYRLGIFGFLASDDIRASTPDGSAGNFGMQDQQFALKWVQNNIAAFNGNVSNVMLFGESAGGGSTSIHLVMESSVGLFHKAAMESGPFSFWIAQSFEHASTKYDAVAAITNCSSTDKDADILACLKSLPTSSLVDVGLRLPMNITNIPFSPTVDGVMLLDHPQLLAARGKIQKVPVLLGTNRDEGTIFLQGLSLFPTQQDVINWVTTLLGPGVVNEALPLYPFSEFSAPWWAASRMIGDVGMSCPARRSARWIYTAFGDDVPVYLYLFSREPSWENLDPWAGCSHAAELPFVFHLTSLLNADETALSTSMVEYWTNFAKYSNPNGPGLVEWPQYANATDFNIVFDAAPNGITVESELKQKECDFWDSVYTFCPPVF